MYTSKQFIWDCRFCNLCIGKQKWPRDRHEKICHKTELEQFLAGEAVANLSSAARKQHTQTVTSFFNVRPTGDQNNERLLAPKSIMRQPRGNARAHGTVERDVVGADTMVADDTSLDGEIVIGDAGEGVVDKSSQDGLVEGMQ